jgi:hypothetical protein
LSNVGAFKNPAIRGTARGRFSETRLYEANCLVSGQAILGSVIEMISDLGKRGGMTMPKREMFTELSRLAARYFIETYPKS